MTEHRPVRSDRARPSYLAALLTGCLAACMTERDMPAQPPSYRGDIEALIEQRCTRCHGTAQAAGGVLLTQYLEVLGCDPASQADRDADAGVDADAGSPNADPGARLLSGLARPDHAQLLAADELARVQAWVEARLPLRDHGVHAPGILNPRSEDWHGLLAARDHFGPLRDPEHPDVCGRCHAGAPVRPASVHSPADSAPACTRCHEQPAGVLACGTCHGDGRTRAAPPRDACAVVRGRSDAHAVHLTSTRLSAAPLRCETCHPTPSADAVLDGRHADGQLDIVFDPSLAGEQASYHPEDLSCSVRCHARGGARATPSFRDKGPLGCGDCHASPPAQHYAGPCTGCHHEADATGSALRSHQLHDNGRVDLGDGSTGCGACHGHGQDPTPSSGSHHLHRDTLLSEPTACDACHRVPERVTADGHLDRDAVTPADVTLGERAHARNSAASYAQGRCSEIACHGAGIAGAAMSVFVWGAGPAQRGCQTCHGLPPPAPHPQDSQCAAATCHGREIGAGAAASISEVGRAWHIDGIVQHGRY